MSYLSMMEARLPPGFRFHPRDEELVCDYLARKLSGEFANGGFSGCPMLIDVDLNKCEPWDLPAIACVGSKEWYFFSLRDRKYATGQRTNRATMSGYWKATGKDRTVARKGAIVGMRKTLVFYQGRAPKGTKTDWVMHEFRMEGQSGGGGGGGGDLAKLCFKEDWVLCRVFFKSRGMSTKASMETWCDESGSSSLPPLMDTYITFDQNQISLEGYEQVPCFSSAPPSCLAPHILPVERSLATRVPGANFGIFHDSTPLSCDKKVIRAVLSHLTKLEGNQSRENHPNMAGGGLGCYISEAGLGPTWNPIGS